MSARMPTMPMQSPETATPPPSAARHAMPVTRLAGLRLMTLTGVASLLAVVLPDARAAGALRWWWNHDPASALAGVTALLAAVVLIIATFVERPRGLGIIGSLLALAAAAIWAPVMPLTSGAVLLVVATLAVIGCAIEVATPAPRPMPSTTLLGWTLGAAIATIAMASLSIFRLTAAEFAPIVSVTAGLAGALALLWVVQVSRHSAHAPAHAPHDARPRGHVLPVLAIGAAMIAALACIVTPVVQGERSGAVSAARVVMLLVTGCASLAALLVAAPPLRNGLETPARRMDSPHAIR